MFTMNFTHGRGDGDLPERDDSLLDGYVYMVVETEDDGKHSSFSGWVTPAVRRLVHAAPNLQRAQYAHERMIGELLELLNKDDLDAARDIVKAEHLSIHGPND